MSTEVYEDHDATFKVVLGVIGVGAAGFIAWRLLRRVPIIEMTPAERIAGDHVGTLVIHDGKSFTVAEDGSLKPGV